MLELFLSDTHTHTHCRGNTHFKKKGLNYERTLSLSEFANLWVFDELLSVRVCVCVYVRVGCSYASVSHLSSLDIYFHSRGNWQICSQSIIKPRPDYYKNTYSSEVLLQYYCETLPYIVIDSS